MSDTSGIKIKRGEWLSDTFVFFLWQAESDRVSPKTFGHLASQRWDSVLRKRVFWQDFDQIFRWSAHEAARRDIRLREYISSSDQPIYRKPYRKSNWNLKDYRKWNVRLHLKSGRFIEVDCQQGGPVRYPGEVVVSWALLVPTKTQRLYERIGRLDREDCHRPKILGVPFDQRPSAYLYPEHAPKPVPSLGLVVQPRRNYQRLLADQLAHNENWPSYLNNRSLSRTLREARSLNIPRETIEARNNMIANLQRDFGPGGESKVA